MTRRDGDLTALIRHLGGGPGVIVGQSLSGGSATIAAATAPDPVNGIVEIGPFTRRLEYSVGALLRNARYRRVTLLMGSLTVFRRLDTWMRYLDLAYPTKPADYDAYMAALRAKLSEPGRMAELLKTLRTAPADAAPSWATSAVRRRSSWATRNRTSPTGRPGGDVRPVHRQRRLCDEPPPRTSAATAHRRLSRPQNSSGMSSLR